VIFLTIGTHEPFDRLLRAVDVWCETSGRGSEVFAQAQSPARNPYRPRNFRVVSRLSQADFSRQFGAASLIVSHAGMGTILSALTLGKPIVIMPRRGHLRETRNDHQFMTVGQLQDRGGIFVAEDEDRLPSVMEEALQAIETGNIESSGRLSPHADRCFTDKLRKFILS